MKDLSYLTFDLGTSHYGVPATAIQEIFFLPAIVALPNVPRWMVGVLDLRGTILPVLDVGLLMGQNPRLYSLNDSIIVLRMESQAVGILVETTREVQAIAPDHITPWGYDHDTTAIPPLFLGIAQVAGTLITLINPETVLALAQQATQSINLRQGWQAATEAEDVGGRQGSWAHLTVAEQQILQQRRDSLMVALDSDEDETHTTLAVMGVQGEFFGLGVDAIREFADIRTITPIPCCPPHILGNLNLRGEVVTLVDISQALNLPLRSHNSWQKAIVVRWDDIVAGIPVENIFDVVHLHPGQITSPPVTTHGNHNDYLQGVAPYHQTLMSVINLPKILTSGVLTVDEEV